MSKWFEGNGVLTEDGERLLLNVKYGIRTLLEGFEVDDMSEEEVRLLGCAMSKMVGDAVANELSHRAHAAKVLGAMTDQEFEDHLKEKYGESWFFMTLTPEEQKRVPLPTQRDYEEAVEQGRKEAEAFRQTLGTYIDKGIRIT
jgi:hypothetical protein